MTSIFLFIIFENYQIKPLSRTKRPQYSKKHDIKTFDKQRMRSRTNSTINTQVDSMILPKIIVDIIVIGHLVRGAVL